jgi:hypothetical protein
MTKQWESLTESEKIEDLRRDVVRIFGLLRQYQDANVANERDLQSQISDLDRRLSDLE